MKVEWPWIKTITYILLLPLKNNISRAHLFILFVIVGRPGVDYPILSAVPYTNFYCDEQQYPGFFADMETRCQGIFLLKFYINCRWYLNLIIFFSV